MTADPHDSPRPFPATTEQCLLGEGARWDDRHGEVLRVDILAGRVFRDRPTADGVLEAVRSYEVPGTVGALAPIEGDDGWLLAAGRGFVRLGVDGAIHDVVADVCPADTRMNDAACDPQGRFWAGTLANDHRAGGGALYRLDRSGEVELMLDDLTISNGLGWSPDGATLYLADSGPREIRAFAFDPGTGAIADGRALVTLAEDIGSPDGLTVDAAGDLWVAVYGGGQVRRYAPDGTLRQVLRFPALQTTSCAFGGAGLNRLYVTTGTEGWSEQQRRADPAAGIVYGVDTDSVGRPAERFRPDPGWWGRMRS